MIWDEVNPQNSGWSLRLIIDSIILVIVPFEYFSFTLYQIIGDPYRFTILKKNNFFEIFWEIIGTRHVILENPSFYLIRRRPIKPNLANFRVWRVIAKDWRDAEPTGIKITQIYAKPTLYNIKEVLILKK